MLNTSRHKRPEISMFRRAKWYLRDTHGFYSAIDPKQSNAAPLGGRGRLPFFGCNQYRKVNKCFKGISLENISKNFSCEKNKAT